MINIEVKILHHTHENDKSHNKKSYHTNENDHSPGKILCHAHENYQSPGKDPAPYT